VSVRIVPGEITAKDATSRVVLPTGALPKFPPLERVAESIARPARRLPLHRHQTAEVLTYVIEGSGSYESPDAPTLALGPGSAVMMTAQDSGAHAINPGRGQTIRYFALVVTVPALPSAAARTRAFQVSESGPQADGSVVAPLVGAAPALPSLAGLEVVSIRFVSEGTSFRRVGHDGVALCYAIAGRASVDGEPLEGGEAALVRDAAGLALAGEVGFHGVLVRVPATAKSGAAGLAAKSPA
jgi:redox-sensitive bicupin YhaK (pirin superfamily)